MTGVLASVTNVMEAGVALEAGADIIDLKNPLEGALGALPLNVIQDVVRFVDGRKPVSATVGDLPMRPKVLCDAVRATAETGVDIVKIGLFGQDEDEHEECARALASVARGGCRVVAVMFADQQPDFLLLPILADAGFYGAMLDTVNKSAGGLRAWMEEAELRNFVASSKKLGLLTGLAGALRVPDILPLVSMQAHYLGFRGALCTNNMRECGLDPERVRSICKIVAQMQHTEHNGLQQGCVAEVRSV